MSGRAPHDTRPGLPPRRRRWDPIDWPLLVGTLSFGALLLLAIYGPLVAPHDVYYTRALLNGAAPPFEASAEYPLGSDIVGHDRFSWFLIGARGTLAIALGAALLRMTIGWTLGTLAALRPGIAATVLRRFALGISSVPATVAALLAVLALSTKPEHLVLALGSVGWAEPFSQARRSASAEATRPFIESARSVGVPESGVVLRHLLPSLAPTLLVSGTFQVAAVLLLMAELALLNLFAGGSTVVDFDARGRAIVAPAEPNWASMLGTTRPIISLYGDLAAVLLPGIALLATVVTTNLLGDALATRAQRLDVYNLFSRRQALALIAVAGVIGASVLAWPSRLANELAYAGGLSGASAHDLARELAAPSFRARVNGSQEAERAAVMLAERLGGQILRGTAAARGVAGTELSLGSRTARPADYVVLSLDDASVAGPLTYATSAALFSRNLPDIKDAIVVLDASSAAGLGSLVQRASVVGASALIALVTGDAEYRRESNFYALPVVRMTPTALASTLGRSVPNLRPAESQIARLATEARLQIRTEPIETPVTNVITRVPGIPSGGPLAVVAARYDNAAGSSTNWSTATSAAALFGIVEHLRANPIPLDVVAIATSGDHQGYAGLRLALAHLAPAERARLQAIVVVGPLLSDALVVQAQTDFTVTSGTARLAARLRDATGVALDAKPAGELLRVLQSARASVAPLLFTAAGSDSDPGANALAKNARIVLAALAYVPNHLDELK